MEKTTKLVRACAVSAALLLFPLLGHAMTTTNLPTSVSGGTGAVANIQTNDALSYTVEKGVTASIGGFAWIGGAVTSVVLHVEFSVAAGYVGTHPLTVNGLATSIIPVEGDSNRAATLDITGGSFSVDTWPEIKSTKIGFINNDEGGGSSVSFDYVYLVINHGAPDGFIPPTWSDEFCGTGPADPEFWTYEEGYQRNNEVQYYVTGASNGWQEDGNFVIEARREPMGGYEYTSASMYTIDKYYWKYGRAQIRARIPCLPGMWPAIWGCGEVGQWPHCGEVDIMEYYNSKILANCAVGTTEAWTAKWDASSRSMTSLLAVDSNWKNEYHIWSIQWDEQNVRLYVDNILMNTIPQTWLKNTDGYNPSWGPQYPFKQPFFCWLNLAIGGAGGDPSGTSFPQRYYIDYWRIWEGATNNVAPTDISLSTNTVSEGLPSGTVVGYLSATDADPAEVIKYTLVTGTGDTHNNQFSIPEFISDNTTLGVLKTAAVLNYSDGATRSIRVRATDIEGATFEKVLTIQLDPILRTVTYQGNNNTGGSVPVDANGYAYGTTVTVLGNTGGLVKTEYTFGGWNTASNGTGTTYSGGDTFAMGSSNVTLHALWLGASYTVTFDANGGNAATPATKAVTVNATYGTLATTALAGYTFAGWFTAASGGSRVTEATVVTTEADHTLYAQWTASLTTSSGPKHFIRGETETNTLAVGYYQTPADMIGSGGAPGAQVDQNVVFGFTLPTLPTGSTLVSATFNFEITAARDSTGGQNLPELHVYLLNSADPTGSGTTFYYHGTLDPSASVEQVGITSVTIPSGVTTQVVYSAGQQFRAFTLSGDALTLLKSFYDGHTPTQSTAYFRFNLSEDPNINTYRRYLVNRMVAEEASSLELVYTPPNTPKLPATVTLGSLAQTYDGTPRVATATTQPEGLEVSLTYDGNALAPTNVGTYAVTGTVVSDTYEGSTNGTLVVSKATPTVTAWPTAAAISEGQALLAATLSGGSASVAGTFSYDAPATVPPVGIYTAAVTFAASDSLNYLSVGGTVAVTVLEAPVAVPTVVGLTQAAASVLLTASNLVVGTVTTAYDATVPAGDVISQNPAAGALVAEGSSVDLVVSLGPKPLETPIVTAWPTAAPITLGQSLSAATLSGGTASVPGGFAYDAPATVPPAGVYAAAVTFTPTDSVNYSNVVGTVNVMVANPYVLPFYEPFEARVTGDLHGQYGWVASHAVVQGSLIFAGIKAGAITNEEGFIKHTFTDARTKVWADVRMQFTPCNEPPVPLADSTANVFVSTNGMLMAFNGTNVVSTGKTVEEGAWLRLTVVNDYTAKTWDLYVDAYKVGRYGFYDTNATAFTEYGVKGGDAAVDNLAITPTAPAGLGRETIIMFK